MNQKNNLVKNASFLMIAAMISKVIGLLYKSPLSSIVGNMGMGYISLAQNAYMILLMIASFSIPQAVSKLISERIALKDYKKRTEDFSWISDLCGNRRRNCGIGVFVWGKVHHSEQSAKCGAGTADLVTYDLSFRNSWCVQGIFSGIQKHDAYFHLADP